VDSAARLRASSIRLAGSRARAAADELREMILNGVIRRTGIAQGVPPGCGWAIEGIGSRGAVCDALQLVRIASLPISGCGAPAAPRAETTRNDGRRIRCLHGLPTRFIATGANEKAPPACADGASSTDWAIGPTAAPRSRPPVLFALERRRIRPSVLQSGT
jgi:hypothetical protein